MKKKTKHLLLLVAVFLLLLGGYFALDFLPETSGEEEETPVETVEITEFTAEDIAYYCYRNAEYELGFYVTEDGYVHYQDAAFPANEASVKGQLSALGNLTAIQLVEGTDKAEYGLDTPEITVAVSLTDGTQRTFLIGDSALFEDAEYVLDVEMDRIYLVGSSFSSQFSCSWSSMVQQEDKIKISSNQIVDISVQNGEMQSLNISYDETKEQPWQLITPEGIYDGDTDAVESAVAMFDTYSLGTTVEYACSDFEKYGLEPPLTTVTVRYTETVRTENQNTVDESGEMEEAKAEIRELVFEFGMVEEDDTTYVRVNGSSYVYQMTKYYAEGLSVFEVDELKYVPEE